MNSASPLAGIVVVELGHSVAAPCAGQTSPALGAHTADVLGA